MNLALKRAKLNPRTMNVFLGEFKISVQLQNYPSKVLIDYHWVFQVNIVEGAALICGSDLNDPDVRIFIDLTVATGGNFYAINNQPGRSLLTLPTLYSSSLVYENAYSNCAAGKTFFIPVTFDWLITEDFFGFFRSTRKPKLFRLA